MKSYMDYRILVVGDGKVRVRYAPTGASGDREDSDLIKREEVVHALQLAQKVRYNHCAEHELQLLGESLYRLLFHGNIEAHFRDAFREATSVVDRGLRLRLEIDHIDAPDLAFLPWEFLRHPGDQYSPAFWFATHTRMVLSRSRAMREVAQTLSLMPEEKIRILLVSASPEGLSPVLCLPVWETIQDLAKGNTLFNIPKMLADTTPRLLDEELYSFQPHILHIIAHGRVSESTGQLALMNMDGKSALWYGAAEFGALFESWTPGLVFLQSCEGAQESPEVAFVSLASQVVQGNVPVVVAMKYSVTNRVATQFANRFYSALSSGEPLDAAVQIGRRAIGRDFGYDSRDFGAPTLLMRVHDGLFIKNDALQEITKTITPSNRTTGDAMGVEHGKTENRQVFQNLPPRTTSNFIGHEEVLSKITSLLSFRSFPHLIAIDGAGGIGKTTLALEVTHKYVEDVDSIPDEERFQAIIWSSAKTSLLTADGVIPRERGINTLEDIYTVISVTLGRQDIIRSDPREQSELVRQALSRQKTLLIIDNYETMEDERVWSFLNEVPATTKVIVTSRRRFDAPSLIHLKELSFEESLSLIKLECQKREIDLPDDRAVQLYERVGGLPLAIVWSVAQIAYGYGVDATLNRLVQATGDIISFCFSHSMEYLLGENARKLVFALSLFASDADRASLIKVAGLEEGTSTDSELVKLLQLSMIESDKNRYRLLPLTKRLVQYELSKDDNFVNAARERLVGVTLDFLNANESALWEHGLPEGVWHREADNVRDVIRWCHLKEKWTELIDLAVAACSFFFVYGQWQELIETAQSGLQALQLLEKSELSVKRLQLLLRLAHLYIHTDTPEKGEPYLDLANEIIITLESVPLGTFETYYFVRSVAAIRMNKSDADAILAENLEFAKKLGVAWRVAGVMGWMGILECHRQNWVKAEELLQEAVRISEESNDVRTITFVYSYLTSAIHHQGRLAEANLLYRKAIVLADQYAEEHNRARLYLGMAELQRDLGNIVEAVVYCNEGVELYSRIGLKGEKERGEMLLKELRKLLP